MKNFRILLLSFLLAAALPGLAQSSSTPSPAPTPAASGSPAPEPQTSRPSANTKLEIEPVKPDAPHRLTAQEKEDLLSSVDEVLRFASRDTLLPIKHSVKKAVISRDEVEKYLDQKFKDDIDRIRFERSELVLKKFGLLPRTFELHSFMIKLLAEQVAGFYNEKSKTMNLLDWVELDSQRPVMAHELTHALQDQSYDLAKMSKREEEIEKRGLEDLDSLIKEDEESTCRTAVLEGQAMIVLVDYVLAPAGKSVEDSPTIVDVMGASMEKSMDSPVFDSAPLLLQEELSFPYRQGMTFIRDLLVAGGKKLAYSGVLDHMPMTTREIMEPKEYLAGRHVPPLLLPDLSFLKKDYEPYDAGAVGEFDVTILLKVYGHEAAAKRLSQEWRGGSYYAAGRKGAKPADRNSSGHVGLFYVSKWSNEAAAQEFAKLYAGALPKRYNDLQHAPADSAKPGLDQYSSSDGPIFIQQTGNVVVAVESFDPQTAGKLIQAGLKQGQDGSQSGTSQETR
jgi:hypothetical protein